MRQRATSWWLALALIVSVAGIYAQTARHPFVGMDDDDYIALNRHVASGLSWDNVAWALTQAHAANWHPLTWISHMVDAQLFGTALRDAGGHHLVSAGLHAINAVLLLFALRSLTGHLWPSAFVAALFAVHPLRVESVAWASERKDVLSGLFFMLALLAYGRYARKPSLQRMLPVLGAHLGGLLAKPTLMTLPFILLTLDIWPLRRWSAHPRSRVSSKQAQPKPGTRNVPFMSLIWEKTPLFAASLASGIITIAAQSTGGAMRGLDAIPFSYRASNALVSYPTYLWKTIWPSGLACFYPHPATLSPRPLESILVILCGLLLVGITWWSVRNLDHRPYLLAGWLWFLVALLPVIGLVQVGFQAWADRYAYLPLVGIYCMAVWLLRDVLPARRGARIVAGTIGGTWVLLLAITSYAQVRVWRDSGELFEHALRVTRDNWFAEAGLGGYAMSQNRLDEAREHFERSLALRPGQPGIHANLGTLFTRQGKRQLAREHLELAVRMSPAYPEALNDLGQLLMNDNRLDDARRLFERALAAQADLPEAHLNLALIHMRLGNLSAAGDHFERVVVLQPANLDARFNLGIARAAEGRFDEAVRSFEGYVRLQPRDAEAHYQLGLALASLGRRDEALSQLRVALEREPGLNKARRALDSLSAPAHVTGAGRGSP